MSDPKRAESNMDDLARLAAPLVSDPPIPATPVGELRRRAIRRTRRRLAAAVVVVVALLGGGVAMAATGRESTEVRVGTGPGTTTSPGFDMVVYLESSATPAQVQAIEGQLLADPDVTTIVYSTADDSFQRFTCMFAADPALVESVQPGTLPAVVSVDFVGGQTEYEHLLQGMADLPGVKVVVPSASDAYELTSPTQGQPGQSGVPYAMFGLAPSSAARDCPVTGSTVRG
jgi:cell division protein FtsX